MGELTTIQIQKKTKAELEGLKEYRRETFDELVSKLVKIVKILEKEPELKQEVIEEMNLAEEQLKKGKGISTKELAKRLGVSL